MQNKANTIKHKAKPKGKNDMKEFIKTLLWALLIAVIFRSLFFQPFTIPSGSMKPNLLVGDFLFASKYSYGLSRHSFPFSPPLWEGRIFDSMPERGDVIVFKLPSDNRTDYVKRLIGLPGDKIQMRAGMLYINDVLVPRARVEDFSEVTESGEIQRIRQYRETLPNGKSYLILDETDFAIADNTPAFEVPDGHYFMMGDNRDNSADSRFPDQVGYVPHDNLVAPARVLFFSVNSTINAQAPINWRDIIRFNRIAKTIN